MTFWPIPDTTTSIQLRYYHEPEPMANFEDSPVLPTAHHDYLWKGLAYHLAERSGSPEASDQREAIYRSWKESEQRMLRALSPDGDSIAHRISYGSWSDTWVNRDGLLPASYPREYSDPGAYGGE